MKKAKGIVESEIQGLDTRRISSTEKSIRATRAEVSLDAIQHNLRQVRFRVGSGVKILAVVKANAYGHGVIEVSKTLLDAGADYLGVAILDEAIDLREHGIEVPILVFAPPFPDESELFLDYNIEATVCTQETAEIFSAVSSSRGRPATVHVKIDTGMGRLGVSYREAIEYVRHLFSLRNLNVKGIYTHFATADEADKTFAKTQLARFHEVATSMSNSGIDIPLKHTANSSAILDLKDSYYNMVRPGIMLYGYFPSHETTESLPLRPALSLRSKVGFLKSVEAGTPISYGRKYISNSPTTIASVSIGYADGFSRQLTNKAEAIVGGRRYPVVGTVCMDYVMLDVGTMSGIKVGDDVTFIGSDGNEKITAWDVADKLGTVPYEICCGISDRVPRVYL